VIDGRKKVSGMICTPEKETVFDYDDAVILLKEVEAQYSSNNLNDLNGSVANTGKIVGNVKIIMGPRDFDKMKDGEILVTSMTRPDFVPILKKAAAIVTDEGGLTCHAAIIARELGIPCIVGTKIATKILKNGQLVEVDGNHGSVKLIK
jgi:phosphoenolpyruvate synthase/pyruvate phosphate dikinase